MDKKKYAEFDNVDCSRLRDCLEVGYMCCEDEELQGSVPGSVAKIARCASTPTRKDRPPRARAHKRALPLALSEDDEENFLVNDRTIPRPALDDIRWTLLTRCVHSPLSEADEETFIVNELTNELFLVLISKDVRWIRRTRVHTHTLCLATSKADKEKIKINERTIPRPHLDDVRWTQRGVRVCVGSGYW